MARASLFGMLLILFCCEKRKRWWRLYMEGWKSLYGRSFCEAGKEDPRMTEYKTLRQADVSLMFGISSERQRPLPF